MPTEPSQHISVQARADRTMDRPAEAVWREIADFPALAAWHPGIATSASHPDSPHLRTLVTSDGAEITEELLLNDDARMIQEYAFTDHHPFPVTDYRARIEVLPEGAARCTVVWTAAFRPLQGDGTEERAQFAEGIFAPGLEALAGRTQN